MNRYRVFVEDVSRGCFSAYSRDISAESPRDAATKSGVKPLRQSYGWERVLAIPVDRKDLWPDTLTGKVPGEAFDFEVTIA